MRALSLRCKLRVYFRSAFAVTLLLIFVSSGLYGQSNGNSEVRNNTPGFVKHAKDLGQAELGTMITATVWLKLHNENLLDRLVNDQYNKKSPGFHKWISQGDFNKTFSPTSQEVKTVQNFLSAHGLAVVEIAENNFYVRVQGTIADMEKTFHVNIHNFSFDGQTLRSNTADPSVDKSSGGHIAAVTGLDDFGFEPLYAFPTDPAGKPLPMRPVSVTPQGCSLKANAFAASRPKPSATPPQTRPLPTQATVMARILRTINSATLLLAATSPRSYRRHTDSIPFSKLVWTAPAKRS
jgi:hypothetical protein